MEKMRVLVIGGGLFGCCIASELSGAHHSVDLVESRSDLMLGASLHNHNRLHLGYHYLRSPETARQSIEGYLTFGFYFGDCVITNFENYYAIAKHGSKSSTEEFENFCNSVGIGYDFRYPDRHFLDRDLLDSCFLVPEPVFDHSSLKSRIVDMLARSRVNVALNTHCSALRFNDDEMYVAAFADGRIEFYDAVINATYANINIVEQDLGIPAKELMFQEVAIPVFMYDHARIGMTVMDGDFCSVMPMGRSNGTFLLYSVLHSVIHQEYGRASSRKSREISPKDIENIFTESSRFMPFLEKVKPIDLFYTTRTIRENARDTRITEVNTYEELPRFFSVLSGKIATCMNVALKIKKALATQTAPLAAA